MLNLLELIFKQPSNYSDMLNKIGIFTFFSLFSAGLLLGSASSTVDSVLSSGAITVNFLSVEEIPVLYFVVPLLVAIAARFIKLHDRISDVLGIRKRFDVRYILLPLAKGVGVKVCNRLENCLTVKRRDLMRKTFYRFASSYEPKIDRHLVIAALDNWSWYWIVVESVLVGLLLVCALVMFGELKIGLVVAGVVFIVASLTFVVKRRSGRIAADEVAAILEDSERRSELRSIFQDIARRI